MPLDNMRKHLLYDRTRPVPALRFCRNDAFVLAGILLLSFLTAVVVFRDGIMPASASQTLYAVVSVDGTEVARLSLSNSGHQSYLVRSPDGNLLVETENRLVSITQSDCPDKICVHTGVISKAGQSVVCLPLKTVLRIEAVDGAAGEGQRDSDLTEESIDAISE